MELKYTGRNQILTIYERSTEKIQDIAKHISKRLKIVKSGHVLLLKRTF